MRVTTSKSLAGMALVLVAMASMSAFGRSGDVLNRRLNQIPFTAPTQQFLNDQGLNRLTLGELCLLGRSSFLLTRSYEHLAYQEIVAMLRDYKLELFLTSVELEAYRNSGMVPPVSSHSTPKRAGFSVALVEKYEALNIHSVADIARTSRDQYTDKMVFKMAPLLKKFGIELAATQIELRARDAGRLDEARDPLTNFGFTERTLEHLHAADIWNLGELQDAMASGLLKRVPALLARGFDDVELVVRTAKPRQFKRSILETPLAQLALDAPLLATLFNHDITTMTLLRKAYVRGALAVAPWLTMKDFNAIERALSVAVTPSKNALSPRERAQLATFGVVDLEQLRGLTEVELMRRYRGAGEKLITVMAFHTGGPLYFDDLARAVGEGVLATPMSQLGYNLGEPLSTLGAVIAAIKAHDPKLLHQIESRSPELVDKIRVQISNCDKRLTAASVR